MSIEQNLQAQIAELETANSELSDERDILVEQANEAIDRLRDFEDAVECIDDALHSAMREVTSLRDYINHG